MSDDASLDDGGRYVYCAAETRGSEMLEGVTGIEDGRVRLVEHDEVGAVVQPVDRVFDATDVATVRQWLLGHQHVVETAKERYGTVLPFRFDTILEGDDAVVERWLAEHQESLRSTLRSLSGLNEYRIQLSWDEQHARERVSETEDALDALEERIASASEGTQFLVEQQYERTLDGLVRDRKSDLSQELYDALAPVVDEIAAGEASATGPLASLSEGTETDVLTTASVLAAETEASTIGNRLERFEQRPGISMRFTGPWPPYTFAANRWEEL